MSEQVEQVYRFIWQYVTEQEALPSQQQIEPRTLLPTAYRAWWCENLRSRWLCPA